MAAPPAPGGSDPGPGASGRSWALTATPAILTLLFAAFALRAIIAYVAFPGSGFSSDIGTFASWALGMAEHGPGGFYANAGFADYPPGYLTVLWPVGLLANALAPLAGGDAGAAAGALIKIPPILADLAVGYLLYRIAVGWLAPRRDALRLGLLAAALYLFNPVTWYDSALWGQVDAVGALVVLAAIALLISGWSEGAAGMAVLAGLIKPQFGLVLAPVVAVVLLRRHLFRPGSGPRPARFVGRLHAWLVRQQGPWRLVSSATVGALVLLVFLVPFGLDVPGFVELVRNTAGGYPYLTVNAYNPWALVGAGGEQAFALSGTWPPDTGQFLLGVPAVVIGGLLLLAGGIVGLVRLAVRDDTRSIVLVVAYLSLAFFILPTRVHERYLFPVFAVLPLLAVRDRRWLIATVVLATASIINLHGVLTTPGYATPNVEGLLFGEAFRSTPAKLLGIALHTGVFAWVLWRLRPSAERDRTMSTTAVVAGGEGAVPIAAVSAGASAPGRVAIAAAGGWDARRGRPFAALRERLRGVNVRRDRTGELLGERGGRLDRLDLLMVVVVLLATLGLRTFRLSEPFDMHFDEVYHARTATEFLQDWRYGIDHDIYEYTHPHLAKYAMALGLVAFGDDRVTSTRSLGVPVTSAALEARWSPDGTPSQRNGDRLYVGTDTETRAYDLRDREQVATLGIAPAALAVDESEHRLFLGDTFGNLYRFDTNALDRQRAGRGGGEHLAPMRIATLGAAPTKLVLAADDSRLVALLTDGTLISLDATTGEELGSAARSDATSMVAAEPVKRVTVDTAALADPSAAAADLATALGEDETAIADQLAAPGTVTIAAELTKERLDAVQKLIDGGLEGVSIESAPTVAVAERSGVSILDAATLEEITTFDLSGPGLGLAVARVDDPTLYVATGRQIDLVRMPGDAAPSKASTVKMPGTVRDVYWDEASGQVHALGRTQDGTADTIYVVEPHGNAVYADARLPFVPAAVALDFQPQRPSDDRQDILALSADGTIATVDAGSHAFAWRMPGVLMSGILAMCLYLLARILFRRRSMALLVSLFALADGMFFANSRIAMNDIYVATCIVAAFTVFAPLYLGLWRNRAAVILGLLAVGVLLGLALASKWVGAYAIGGVVLLVLLRSALGRLVALTGMVALTAVLGLLAISADPAVAGASRNFLFLFLMLGLTLLLAVLMVVRPVRFTREELRFAVLGPAALGVVLLAVGGLLVILGAAPPKGGVMSGRNLALGGGFALVLVGVLAFGGARVAGRLGLGPLAIDEPGWRGRLLGPSTAAPEGWLRPGARAGIPWLYALACLSIVPLFVYVVSYAPWAAINNDQWGIPLIGSVPFMPRGGTGTTLLDLTKSMYDYHNDLRATHPASSPWWAWPFDLKPVWFYQDGFAGTTTGVIYDSGNLVLFWLSIPAVAFAALQAWRRRSLSLTLVIVAISVMWLPWARIDRATFQYHVFTTLPFSFLALAYFVAELWHGPSWRTWLLARAAAALAIVGAPLLWLGRGSLCTLAGVEGVHPGGQACGTVTQEFTVTISTVLSAVVLLVGVGLMVWQMRSIAAARRTGAGGGVELPASVARRLGRDTLPAALLPAATLVATSLAVLVASRTGETPLFKGPLGASGPAVVALPALLVLGVVAMLVLGARDSRRWVVVFVGMACLWFAVWYPNLSGLPLPDAIANNYLMTLPTYNYDFQFAVNTDQPFKASIVNPETVLFLVFLAATVLAAMYATYAWRLELAARREAGRLGPPPPLGPPAPTTAPPETGTA